MKEGRSRARVRAEVGGRGARPVVGTNVRACWEQGAAAASPLEEDEGGAPGPASVADVMAEGLV